MGSDDIGAHCLGGIGIFNLIDPDNDGNTGIGIAPNDISDICSSCIKDSIAATAQQLIAAGGDSPYSLIVEAGFSDEILVTHLEEKLGQWINYAIYVSVHLKSYELAEAVLLPLNSWRWQKNLFGIYALQGKWGQAQNLIDAMPQSTSEQSQFRQIQQMNLDRLSAYQNAQPITETDLQELTQWAEGTNSTQGYARTLLRLLTGQVTTSLVPDIGQLAATRSKHGNYSENGSEEIKILPNPASDQLQLSVQQAFVQGRMEYLQFSWKFYVWWNIRSKTSIFGYNCFVRGGVCLCGAVGW